MGDWLRAAPPMQPRRAVGVCWNNAMEQTVRVVSCSSMESDGIMQRV